MGATPGFNREWKVQLVKQGAIDCGHCGYHKGENATASGRDDRYKSLRRLVRRFQRRMEERVA